MFSLSPTIMQPHTWPLIQKLKKKKNETSTLGPTQLYIKPAIRYPTTRRSILVRIFPLARPWLPEEGADGVHTATAQAHRFAVSDVTRGGDGDTPASGWPIWRENRAAVAAISSCTPRVYTHEWAERRCAWTKAAIGESRRGGLKFAI